MMTIISIVIFLYFALNPTPVTETGFYYNLEPKSDTSVSLDLSTLHFLPNNDHTPSTLEPTNLDLAVCEEYSTYDPFGRPINLYFTTTIQGPAVIANKQACIPFIQSLFEFVYPNNETTTFYLLRYAWLEYSNLNLYFYRQGDFQGVIIGEMFQSFDGFPNTGNSTENYSWEPTFCTVCEEIPTTSQQICPLYPFSNVSTCIVSCFQFDYANYFQFIENNIAGGFENAILDVHFEALYNQCYFAVNDTWSVISYTGYNTWPAVISLSTALIGTVNTILLFVLGKINDKLQPKKQDDTEMQKVQ